MNALFLVLALIFAFLGVFYEKPEQPIQIPSSDTGAVGTSKPMQKLEVKDGWSAGYNCPEHRLQINPQRIYQDKDCNVGIGTFGFDYTVRDLVNKYVDDPIKQSELEIEIYRLIEKRK